MSKADALLEPGRNCWRVERADRAALIVDAADYFRLRPRRRCCGPSADPADRLGFRHPHPARPRRRDDGAPAKLGPFISWLAKNRPGLSIHILKWDLGAVKLLGRGTTIFRLARWAWNKQIFFKLDGAHPFGGSHHQKIVVIDDSARLLRRHRHDRGRWDTRDASRRRPAAPAADHRPPLRPLARRHHGGRRRRGARAGRARARALEARRRRADRAAAMRRRSLARGARAALPRRRGGDRAHPRRLRWRSPAVREIEALFVDMIARARRFVYAENQYFASRAIAEAIAERLAEPDGPEFVHRQSRSGSTAGSRRR